ncbi:MAG: hypothetical protein CMH83_12895 [Nocardioides sp.]|nr:hypothetical protein [Nocardioides sp.]
MTDVVEPADVDTRVGTTSAAEASAPAAATGSRARRVPGTVPVFLLGVACAAAASAYTLHAGTNLDYGDAMAHLTIARRITDNQNPGLAQLGSVWLPLPHLLLLPLVQSMWLFSTGLAGSVVSALCLGATSAATWRLMHRLGLPLPAMLAGLVLLLANPALLYVSSTALTEPVLLACLTMTIAGLAGWAFSPRQLSGGELAVFAGIPAAAGVLTRYEAWPLVLAGAFLVAVVSLRRGRGVRQSAVWTLSFVVPSIVAVLWWVAYNQIVFGDALEFLQGEYSASAFADVFEREGELTTAGNLGLSSKVLGWAMLETSGIVLLVLAAVGLVTTSLLWRLDDRNLVTWLGGSTTAFLLFSLTTGQHIMVNDAAMPPGAYNNRYVLSALPWLSVLAAIGLAHVGAALTRRRTSTAVAAGQLDRGRPAHVVLLGGVVVATVLQNLYWLGDPYERMTVIQEAHVQHLAYVDTKDAARWLREHYDGGGILMDQTPDKSSVAPVLGLPIDEFYTRASGAVFEEAIADPYGHARWVFMHRSQVEGSATDTGLDRVTARLALDPQFHARYRLVYAVEDIGIYRIVEGLR